MLTVSAVAQVTLALALPTSIILIYWWYKNASDEDAFRVVTSKNSIAEVKVPQRAIGAIIGRQGSKIKQIQKDTGAWMHFESREGENGGGDNTGKGHRTLVIQGTPESVNQAELMIHQMIADMPEVLTEEIEVPQFAVGRIIGKGGATIREMSNTSKAKIIIDRNDSTTDPHFARTVSLTGSRQQIDTAMALIESKIEEEEEFRAKQFVSGASGERKNEKKEQKKPATVKTVPQSDESWDSKSVKNDTAGQENLSNNIHIAVYISAVEHPEHFWVQMIGVKEHQLEQLQTDITHFACSDDAKLNYRLTEVKPGDMVAARFEDNDLTYYRAKILGETKDGKVDVYYVDYGDSGYLERKDVFKLRSDFTNFPHQAVECALANVKPVGEAWSEEAINCFEDLAHCAKWKDVQARVVTYRNLTGDEKMPVVQLIDSDGAEEIDIGAELIKRGFALPVDSVGLNPQDSVSAM